ncbi:hypothetical protein AAVH_39706, partial [Aphelenchoides avenae]
TSAVLHEVRYGKITKHRNKPYRYDPSSARGAPLKRGRGGSHGTVNRHSSWTTHSSSLSRRHRTTIVN